MEDKYQKMPFKKTVSFQSIKCLVELDNLFLKITNRRKEPSIWHIRKEFHLKNPNHLTSIRKCIQNGASKNCKSVRKVSKFDRDNESKVIMNFK